MWRTLAESSTGTSHLARSVPCQDAHRLGTIESVGGTVLIVAVADGAGSAKFAEVGATVACNTLLAETRADLLAGTSVAQISRDALVKWMLTARAEIVRQAEERQVRLRELACTAILAVIGENSAAFAQIGDGAIVVSNNGSYAPVFWPAPAEYANVTDFLTDDGAEDRIVVETIAGRVDEFAVLSDGLQRLALDYSSRRGHAGFFGPLFATLRDHPAPAELADSLRQFLASSQVNARTDDDKTLVLATRLPRVCPPRTH
ncbi:serine threonine phosphoprotein phosphatase : Serine/threonine protein phosphatase OS=Myxococcus stipitatus (strain DSM 14675 / JCM 12634 / Mx s8) GN=MYSTI_02389 PE=4 SV=1: PP2C_2 [Gemmata massiliana]|uniref:PPM-type phosphatase domain-containing protein n=1 Tax=Gemmata massiliana TaxID=1210884 RepID=A0A6P2CZG5_9BACT|nr:PP2C family serine/threonine-protein phosphatase [Gemmata massiliana]VTR93756.1 serine threonine phosphoprotein phosphatase : Serine/threonine protein phosphatase OS=Myxococcus stipitatus (strain DSM 14675 / JCM 12634 / Mx s8) GN=MYSTI_02389 PE=4 SV=1: PP2C_2 [Gemmata massiliana]